jgi:two-component system response regulator PilR (NtrC family)
VEHFFRKHHTSGGGHGRIILSEALKALMNYPFPGNVRELENIVERSLVLDPDRITLESLPLQVRTSGPRFDLHSAAEIPDEGIALEPALEDLEKQYLLKSLEKSGGVKKKAAELLGMTFRSFRYKLAKYALESDGD